VSDAPNNHKEECIQNKKVLSLANITLGSTLTGTFLIINIVPIFFSTVGFAGSTSGDVSLSTSDILSLL
jgi:hypothetical protein